MAPRVDAASDVDSAVDVRALAQAFHDDGFVALQSPQLQPSAVLVERTRTAVLRLYDAHIALAKARQLDLTLLENAEKLAGFYVRQGGRIDMQISSRTPARVTPHIAAIIHETAADPHAHSVTIDSEPFYDMAQCWQRVIDEIFASATDSAFSSTYRLEYIGCVVSRPGDANQNWHLDGVHRNLEQHERADRLNVFVPLVDLTESVGGTEMKRASHVRAANDSSASFTSYEHLPSVTHTVPAGTPVIMDYRVWHRGLANTSAPATLRPLLYFKYEQQQQPRSAKRPVDEIEITVEATKRPRKRVVLSQVQSTKSSV